MTVATQGAGGGGPSPSGLADVIDTILDKGLVIDAYVRVSLVGIELADGKPTKTALDALLTEEDGEHPLWLERTVWLSLYEKFRLSVEHRSVVVFH